MTDDIANEELAEANRREVHPVCYAVFLWAYDWEKPPDVQCTWDELKGNIFRINVLQFLTREESTCLHLCCRDALLHMNLLEEGNIDPPWENEWFDDCDSDY